MIDARTGQPEPCPMCASTNVRWRQRRWSDYPLNWLRFVFESVFGFVSSGRRNANLGVPGSPQGYEYDEYRLAHDEHAASLIPRFFWKCADCGRKGEIFGSLDTTNLERITELERDLRAQGGVVSDPKETGRRD
jgi:hypothetical protein